MPLIKSSSKKAFTKNVKAELESGKPIKQAVAIAYSVKERAKRNRMEKLSFKETIVLAEARRSDLKYTEKAVKNKLDRVTVELSGSDSGAMTKLASRFDRLDKAIKKMGEKRTELNDQLKSKVADLFNAEDVVLTRVVETASFAMTLSKLVKGSEQDPKTVIDYEKIAMALAELIPDELQSKVDEIVKMYTEISIAADRSPSLRVKSKVDESLNEGVIDMLKAITAKIAKVVRSFAAWAVKYDRKLAALKLQASAA